MSELILPKKRRIIKLELQPQFPAVDLNEDNAQSIKHILSNEGGLDTYSDTLQHEQRYIHMVADQALKIIGIKTRFEQTELAAFSHGFASFETINDMVHPPRLYDIDTARKQVANLFVDTRDSLDIEIEELLLPYGDSKNTVINRDKFAPEFELADSQKEWEQSYPNTYEVIIEIGEKRDENMRQLHARTAGAHLAYKLQQQNLDAA